jgi:acetyl-CoA acyltransferase
MSDANAKSKPRGQSAAAPAKGNGRRRVAVIAGVRTPFARAFGELSELDTIDLGVAAVRGLLDRTGLDPAHVDEVVWGSVIFRSDAPNTAREIVFDANLPRKIPGLTVTRACLSGLQAITHAAAAIERGDVDVVIAGGSDSTTNAEAPMPRKLVRALGEVMMTGGGITAKKLKKALGIIGSPANLLPTMPKIAERATGLTMGQHADDMARKNGITREAQDAFAIRSHERAHAAIVDGRFDDEVVPVDTGRGRRLERDTLVRSKVDADKVARLKPVFRKDGTITAASSSPLTDGASCVLLMSEEKARALGFPVEVVLRDWAYEALDPFDELLLGPALAVPELLDKAGLTLDEIDVLELHEAFAAQALRVVQALASESFAKERLGRDAAVGTVPDERLNPHGGSVAIGHPFAATGGRLVTTAANELRQSGKRYAIVTLCAAGAHGGAALLERV